MVPASSTPPVPQPPKTDFDGIIHAVRLDLESAGNPSFLVAIMDAAGAVHSSPMIFSSVKPANDQARRVAAAAASGERVFIVSRQAQRDRQVYRVLSTPQMRSLHKQEEVIELTFGQAHGPV